jgi:hypothetical protein
MKKSYKIAYLFALLACATGLIAQEVEMESGEITRSEEACPTPGDCQDSVMEFDYRKHDPDDCDYDVYTQGSKDDECETQGSCRRNGRCNRKGAAKYAQE